MKKYSIGILLLLLLILPSRVLAADISTTTCPGAGCVDINVAGQGSLGIQITGTWAGTVTFQSSLSTVSGGTFTSLLVTPSGSTTAVTTTTANGVWSVPVAGFSQVRVVFTSYSSGTAVVVFRSTNQARANTGSSGGGGGSGTVTQVDTTGPIGGGPITTTGTITCTTCGVTGSGLNQFASTTSAQLAGVISNETGSGLLVFATSPTLITPLLGTPTSGNLVNTTGYTVANVAGLGTGVATALGVNVGSAGAPVLFNGALGTPSSGTLTSATGLPISTGVSGLGSNVATFLATPSSTNLITAVTDETGSGVLTFATSPTFTTNITLPQATFTGASILDGSTSNTIEQYNSTTAQILNIYNTRTNSTNYERGFIRYVSNVLQIGHEGLGTGNTGRNIALRTSGFNAVTIDSNNMTLGVNILMGTGTLTWSGSRNSTSGTVLGADNQFNYNPSSTSTMLAIPVYIRPTINYSNGTPGAGAYEALKIAVIETALPTGTNYLIRTSAGAAGTTDRFTVDNAGVVTGVTFIPTTSYKSVDGTTGVTVTTCTGFKNGLCISGT